MKACNAYHHRSNGRGLRCLSSVRGCRAGSRSRAAAASPRRQLAQAITATTPAGATAALTQITPAERERISASPGLSDRTRPRTVKSSPLLVDGVLYFTVPDNVWAVDARSGHQIWHYTYPANKGFHIGHRGVAMYKDWLYFMTPDAHLICLNAKDGTVRWNVVVADSQQGLLDHHGAAGRPQSRDRRRLRRLR